MKITKATYGDYDVLDIVRSLVKDNTLQLSPSNKLFNKDPKPGVVKYLNVVIDNEEYSIKENEYFLYPKTLIKKLGIFYTNNNIPSVVEYCLKDLIKFKDQTDIISCVWKPIPNNPFHEIIADTQHSHHLNITIQILQLLYTANKYKQYDYVSFLEHDVLYPNDYFNFDGFDDQYNGLVNKNYIGLCDSGFQHKNQNDSPLHQITMRFNNAIDHFESMILMAIKNKSIILEPVKLQERFCKSPSLHINHGYHFTSHYNIYSKNNIFLFHNEWGYGEKLMNHIIKKYK